MFLLTYALPIAAALLLIAFFSGLPLLSCCALPEACERRFDRRDALILALITLLYALVAFRNLGNTRSPESFVPMEGRSVVLTLPEGALPAAYYVSPVCFQQRLFGVTVLAYSQPAAYEVSFRDFS